MDQYNSSLALLISRNTNLHNISQIKYKGRWGSRFIIMRKPMEHRQMNQNKKLEADQPASVKATVFTNFISWGVRPFTQIPFCLCELVIFRGFALFTSHYNSLFASTLHTFFSYIIESAHAWCLLSHDLSWPTALPLGLSYASLQL